MTLIESLRNDAMHALLKKKKKIWSTNFMDFNILTFIQSLISILMLKYNKNVYFKWIFRSITLKTLNYFTPVVSS